MKTLEQEELGYILTTKANLSLCYMGVRPIQHCVKKKVYFRIYFDIRIFLQNSLDIFLAVVAAPPHYSTWFVCPCCVPDKNTIQMQLETNIVSENNFRHRHQIKKNNPIIFEMDTLPSD